MVVGGFDGLNYFSSAELYPRPPSDTCTIPSLPQGRRDHSVSLLPGGKLVVCGGFGSPGGAFDTCISWVAGNTSWTPLHTMRCLQVNVPQSALSNTVWREGITLPGPRPLFPKPLSCLAAEAVQQISLQNLCQVKQWQASNPSSQVAGASH